MPLYGEQGGGRGRWVSPEPAQNPSSLQKLGRPDCELLLRSQTRLAAIRLR